MDSTLAKKMNPGANIGWVLVVDDDHDISETLGAGLAAEGYKVMYAFTAAEAIQKLKNQAFAGVVLDVCLSEESGEQVVSYMKTENKLNRKTPILLISAFVDIGLVSRMRDDVNGILVKPFSKDMFVERFRNILEKALRSMSGQNGSQGSFSVGNVGGVASPMGA